MAATSKSDTTATSWRSFRALQVCLGLLLLTAAALKTHQLATEPVLKTGMLESRWFLVAVVQFELLLSLWLSSGMFPRAAWWVLLVTFGTFALVAARKVVVADASCGCFGRVATPPWAALLIDGSAIVGLCWCRVPEITSMPFRSGLHRVFRGVDSVHLRPVAKSWRLYMSSLAAWLAAASVLAFFALRPIHSAELSHIGQRVGDVIVVEPERMVGQPFQLTRFIDVGDELTQGDWLVVFYRTDCPKCHGVLSHLVSAEVELGQMSKLALVAVPPIGRASPAPARGALRGRLGETVEWFVPTPLLVRVGNGRVVGVYRTLEDAIGATSELRETNGLQNSRIEATAAEGQRHPNTRPLGSRAWLGRAANYRALYTRGCERNCLVVRSFVPRLSRAYFRRYLGA